MKINFKERPFLKAFKTALTLAVLVVGVIGLLYLGDFLYANERFALPLWCIVNVVLFILLIISNKHEPIVVFPLLFFINVLGWGLGALLCWFTGYKIMFCTPILIGMVSSLLFFIPAELYSFCVAFKKNYKEWYHHGVIKNWVYRIAGFLTGIILFGILIYAFYLIFL